MKLNDAQIRALADLTKRLRDDIPPLVNAMVPEHQRVIVTRMMLAIVPPVYLAMELERMRGTPSTAARNCVIYAHAVGISGVLSMTEQPENLDAAVTEFMKILSDMLHAWVKGGGNLPGPKLH